MLRIILSLLLLTMTMAPQMMPTTNNGIVKVINKRPPINDDGPDQGGPVLPGPKGEVMVTKLILKRPPINDDGPDEDRGGRRV